MTERNHLTEASIVAFLEAIERGDIALTMHEDPIAMYAGDLVYSASNGWRIVIFNDCVQWDYIDHIEAFGEVVDFDEIDSSMPKVANYRPSRQVEQDIYGIRYRD